MLKIGTSSFTALEKKVPRGLCAAELLEMTMGVPRSRTLESWKSEAPKGFEFVSVLPRCFFVPDPGRGFLRPFEPLDAAKKLWEKVVGAMDLLGSRCCVMLTDHTFRPSMENRQAMSLFLSSVDRGEIRLAWRPRGIWTQAEIGKWCDDLGLVQCVDPFQMPEGRKDASGFSYLRIEGLGRTTQGLKRSEVEHLAQVAPMYTGFCILDTLRPHQDAQRVARLLDQSASS